MKQQSIEKLRADYIDDYLQTLGYTLILFTQPWRHGIGRLIKNKKDYFFKIAATIEISPRIVNEPMWYKMLENVPTLHQLAIRTPKIVRTGVFEDLYWYIAEFFDGEILSKESTFTNNEISLLAQTAKKFMALPVSSEIAHLPYPPITPESILEKLLIWQKESKTDVSTLIEFIKQRLSHLSFAPAHGDFTPEHVVKAGDTYALVDFESARPDNIKYYDVAYCFHRIYTKLKRPDLAEQFLQEFLQLENLNETKKSCLELAIAQRLIGGYFDAKTDNVTSMDLQRELEEKLLQNKLPL